MQDTVSTSDGNNIRLNIQHAIVIKESNSSNDLFKTLKEAKEL
jgi:hypothetical protein